LGPKIGEAQLYRAVCTSPGTALEKPIGYVKKEYTRMAMQKHEEDAVEITTADTSRNFILQPQLHLQTII
jgi:hypothetical protein